MKGCHYVLELLPVIYAFWWGLWAVTCFSVKVVGVLPITLYQLLQGLFCGCALAERCESLIK